MANGLATKGYAIMLRWPLGTNNKFPLRLFAVGPYLYCIGRRRNG